MTLWVVGLWRATTDAGQVWDLIGIFGAESPAEARCTTPAHFMAPFNLDHSVPDKLVPWPGLRWPRREQAR